MEFTLGGHEVTLSSKDVEQKLRGVAPERIQTLAVEVSRVAYPVKQALSVSSGLDRADFTSHQAWHVFKKLGFRVTRTT